MPDANPAALAFLGSRRSRPAKTLLAPAPGPDALDTILTLGARVPDHGKLEPWRFLVLTDAALPRVADQATARATELGFEAERQTKIAAMFRSAPLIVTVISAPKPSDKIPEFEQVLSAGAVCLSIVNAALAAGWGANWLSGPLAMDGPFLDAAFGLAPGETVAGFFVLGTETSPPPERPRPDIAAITRWISA